MLPRFDESESLVVKVELPLLSPAASDIAQPPDEEEPEMDSVEKEEELDDTNRYR
jgi:hypothetical protein